MVNRYPVKDVVVMLPGILGSVLEREGKEVWALSTGALFRGLLTLGRSVTSLELSGDDTGRDLDDGVRATRLMPDVHLIPGFWKIDGYGKIKQRMFDLFDFTEGLNWFDFAYDWRRDNRVAAAQLAELAPRWLSEYRRQSGQPDAKLILVGHSMGGLVARHYLEILDGWKDTRALVTFGTPYRGSLNALNFLANGLKKGLGPLRLDLTRMLRSFPSVYELLPIYPCVDDGTGTPVKIAAAAGLPEEIDHSRVVAAQSFHNDIAEAVDRNGGSGRYHILPVAGIFQPTLQSAEVRNRQVSMKSELAGDDDGGDGTVPRVSATPIELSDAQREVYATESHAALQNVDAVLVQLAGLLTWKPLGPYRGSPFDGLRLEVDDVIPSLEPVEVGIATAAPILNVGVLLENLDTGDRFERRGEVTEGQAKLVLPPIPAGLYRITAQDLDNTGVKPVHDLLLVSDDATAEQILDAEPG
jgi:pimeloyl-ACP methyl ester carboxylesterase